MPNEEFFKPIPFIRELCKHKTEEEILEAEYRFRKYVEIVKRIADEDEDEDLPIIDF